MFLKQLPVRIFVSSLLQYLLSCIEFLSAKKTNWTASQFDVPEITYKMQGINNILFTQAVLKISTANCGHQARASHVNTTHTHTKQIKPCRHTVSGTRLRCAGWRKKTGTLATVAKLWRPHDVVAAWYRSYGFISTKKYKDLRKSIENLQLQTDFDLVPFYQTSQRDLKGAEPRKLDVRWHAIFVMERYFTVTTN
jgi:hypothetical protein